MKTPLSLTVIVSVALAVLAMCVYADPPAHTPVVYQISGAGTPEANGTYVEVGVFNGATCWRNQATGWCLFWHAFHGMVLNAQLVEYDTPLPNPEMRYAYYWSFSDIWQVGQAGQAPAPMMVRANQ